MRPLLRRLIVAVACMTSLTANGDALAWEPHECPIDDPDSLQISWDSPCLTGGWLMDTEQGCRMWDWHPAPADGATWTGACHGGAKAGRGVVQWYEHGKPIDRFEGTFAAGRREGHGRYTWNEIDWFDGTYRNDVPHGPGVAHIAGEVFSGDWRHGCLRKEAKVVAIGVPRKSCESRQRVATASP